MPDPRDTNLADIEAAAGGIGDAGTRGYDTFLSDYTIGDNSLGQSEYDFRYRVFPSDLANDYVGHYIVININVPVYSTKNRADPRTAYTGAQFNQTILDEEYSKVDALRFGNALDVGGLSPVAGTNVLNKEPFSVPRYTRRIKESIAMFMPTPVTFNTVNDFQEIGMTSLGLGIATQTAAALAGSIFGERGSGLVSSLANAVGANGQKIGQVASIAGYPINPRIEVMFSKTNLRQFVLEFLMAPRNPEESESMKAIIRTLRYHAAPEIDNAFKGFTWIPPAEFDITFYNKGVENTNIPRINTCVLDRIEVDYAPTGVYSTFSNGHPVAARLSMGMREIEVVHKRRVLQGF